MSLSAFGCCSSPLRHLHRTIDDEVAPPMHGGVSNLVRGNRVVRDGVCYNFTERHGLILKFADTRNQQTSNVSGSRRPATAARMVHHRLEMSVSPHAPRQLPSAECRNMPVVVDFVAVNSRWLPCEPVRLCMALCRTRPSYSNVFAKCHLFCPTPYL